MADKDTNSSEINVTPTPASPERRKFLGSISSIAAVTAGASALGMPSFLNAAEVGPLSPKDRANLSLAIRTQAALAERALPIPAHPTNGDEELYSNQIGSYSKGLPHNDLGEVDVAAYALLVRAMKTGNPSDFEAIPSGSPVASLARRQVDPQAALAFDLQGADSHHLAMIAPPAFSSREEAGEIAENYWMAILRDVPFSQYSSHPDAIAAAADLSSYGNDFKGPKINGQVTPQTLFRGNEPGVNDGPAISQFFSGAGSIPFGAQRIDPKVLIAQPGLDYMTNYDEWLAVQRGITPSIGNTYNGTRYCTTGRDVSTFVHIDALYQGFLNSLLAMLSNGRDSSGNPLLTFNQGNPYGPVPDGGAGFPLHSGSVGSRAEVGFGTFGGPHILSLITEVATRALKAAWYQKWSVHRRLRPEAFAGRIHNMRTGKANYPIHSQILNSSVLDKIHQKTGSYLLPMAFPEGSPCHPAYAAGHGTVAGACVTILKAWYDGSKVIPNPTEASADGQSLVPVDATLTVEGELNKIATNIAYGRNIAGVHWRTDGRESLRLGEQIAISILRDQKFTYNEVRGSFPGGGFKGFTFNTFDGNTVTV